MYFSKLAKLPLGKLLYVFAKGKPIEKKQQFQKEL
jgi:hypothetical protein